MTRLHVGPGVDDWDDQPAPDQHDPPTRADLAELETATWNALFHQAKYYEEDRWAS